MSQAKTKNTWPIFKGNRTQHDGIADIPKAPKWRLFEENLSLANLYIPDRNLEHFNEGEKHRATTLQTNEKIIELVNAALYLRRPLLVTGKAGTGKSSLAYAVAYELKLGKVLYWPITSRSTLSDALYRYDALGRLQDTNIVRAGEDGDLDQKKAETYIGKYIRLGPLGTALLPTHIPQVLLIDEIDKSSIDLPNDLLYIFETGGFEIPELSRLPDTEENKYIDVFPQVGGKSAKIYRGQVTCKEFPFVVITSNGEREFPPAFLRRCIRLDIDEPDKDQLAQIVENKFLAEGFDKDKIDSLIVQFLSKRQAGDLATDQLLNAIYLTMCGVNLDKQFNDKSELIDAILRHLSTQEIA